jgi:putative transposase
MKNVDWKIVNYLRKLSLDIDSTIHFNPEKYCSNIDIKIQSYKTSRHQKYMANYHIVFVTRGRCKVFFKEVRDLIKYFIEIEFEKYDKWDLLACEVMPEHIHMFISLDNVHHPYQFVGKIRNAINENIQKAFPILNKALGNQIFNRSFYWGTIGNVTGVGVLKYISKQWENSNKERYYKTKQYLEKKNMNLTQFF